MNLAVMIEGQEGLDWDLWRRISRATEDLGFESLFRSDHFFSLSGPRDRDALETFVSFVMTAQETSRIHFGSLVASMTFRHPSLLARMAAQIDVLSGGRFILGVGAGWNVPEHEAFGLPFPPVRERMDRLDEGIRVIKGLWGQGPATFEGHYYSLKDVDSHPKPAANPQQLLVGGSGERRTLRIVAEHATEWNGVGLNLEGYLHKRSVLEQHCADIGRDPATIRHSQMGGFVIGKDEAAVRAHLGRIAERNPMLGRGAPDEVLAGVKARGWLVGTPGEIVDELGRREEAGISRTMLQHHAMSDFATLELVAAEVLPQVQR
ncbi:MAG: TIGR03560 family F420-dependent LLM class oxidoreductase [Chloroflexi bacterium]|nr:TIGR03560 family F420-dependent LLM class oxidoreductase [Chloroflexota bacterium]MDA1240736.1 TIGR03560 family F420-dependent LLM class oxidoreductase [Chloroflexota bacterium]